MSNPITAEKRDAGAFGSIDGNVFDVVHIHYRNPEQMVRLRVPEKLTSSLVAYLNAFDPESTQQYIAANNTCNEPPKYERVPNNGLIAAGNACIDSITELKHRSDSSVNWVNAIASQHLMRSAIYDEEQSNTKQYRPEDVEEMEDFIREIANDSHNNACTVNHCFCAKTEAESIIAKHRGELCPSP